MGERERGRWLTTNIEVQVPWSRFTRHLEQGFDHSNLLCLSSTLGKKMYIYIYRLKGV